MRLALVCIEPHKDVSCDIESSLGTNKSLSQNKLVNQPYIYQDVLCDLL